MPSVSPPRDHLISQNTARMHTLFIGGHWVTAKGAVFTSYNPADSNQLWEGRAATAEDVNDAVEAARAAAPKWAATSLEERVAHLEKFRDVLEQHKEEMATLISRETGKVRWDAMGEMGAMIGKIAISIKAYHERTGTKESTLPDGGKAVLRHKPHGVVAVFGPYNFPAHLPNGHIVPALLAGNTVVFKPSEMTPAVGEYMVQMWEKAGLPKGVLNLVQGEKETGIALANHPQLDGLFFTGSSATGHILHKQFAGRPEKILALEMGGNNPLIVTEVKDQKAAAYLTIQSAFVSSGQRCTCARRLIVPEGKEGDALLQTLQDMVQTIQVGAWDDEPQPFMGPLIALTESEKLMAAEEALIAQGAKALVPMQRLRDDLPFLSPGLIDVTSVKNLEDRELFGPLLHVIRVKDFDAAIQAANNTAYGLSAGLISDNAALYERCKNELRAGILNWNRPLTGASSAAPFGGIGTSGNHRASAYYAADYCAYPVASMESDEALLPDSLSPGVRV